MQKILRYTFKVATKTKIPMPLGAQILEIQRINGIPSVVALVDPTAKEIGYNYLMIQAGGDVPEGFGKDDYIGMLPGESTGHADTTSPAYYMFKAT
jgi:hypothetical protein